MYHFYLRKYYWYIGKVLPISIGCTACNEVYTTLLWVMDEVNIVHYMLMNIDHKSENNIKYVSVIVFKHYLSNVPLEIRYHFCLRKHHYTNKVSLISTWCTTCNKDVLPFFKLGIRLVSSIMCSTSTLLKK